MTLNRLFHWSRIQGEGRAYQPLLAGLRETTFPVVQRAGTLAIATRLVET